jgi:hypothetical protein
MRAHQQCGADRPARATMNIVTYASPVALQPPVYAIGLYKGTQSWANWRANRGGLLQAGATRESHCNEQAGRVLTSNKHALQRGSRMHASDSGFTVLSLPL